MPTRKDGKNWIVNYTVTLDDGSTHDQSRKFRVRDDAQAFINNAKRLITDPRSNAVKITHTISKIEK